MKLIDIMKRYNKCILKENAKLRSIYNTLIRECDGSDTENECDVSEEDKKIFFDEEDEGTDETKLESADESHTMSIAEFIGEADKENGKDEENECDACGDPSCKDGEKCGLKEEEDEEIEEGEMLSAEEFFGGAKKPSAKKGDKKSKKDTDECDACGDPSCKDGEKCGLKEEEDEESISEEEFMKPALKGENKADGEKAEESISEEEFMKPALKDEKTDESEKPFSKDAFYGKTDESKNEETKKDAKKLSESLRKNYRAANRKLFSF